MCKWVFFASLQANILNEALLCSCSYRKKLFLHLSFVARPAACDQSGCAAHCQLCRPRVCTYVLPHPWISLQIVIWIWVLLYHFHSAPSSVFMLVRSEGRYRQTSTKRAVRENETFQLAAALDCQMQQGCDLSDLWHSLTLFCICRRDRAYSC